MGGAWQVGGAEGCHLTFQVGQGRVGRSLWGRAAAQSGWARWGQAALQLSRSVCRGLGKEPVESFLKRLARERGRDRGGAQSSFEGLKSNMGAWLREGAGRSLATQERGGAKAGLAS